MSALIDASRASHYYGPVTDGRSLPRDPFTPDAPLLSADIPVLMGNTHDETRLLIGGGDPSTFSLTWDCQIRCRSQHSSDLGRPSVTESV